MTTKFLNFGEKGPEKMGGLGEGVILQGQKGGVYSARIEKEALATGGRSSLNLPKKNRRGDQRKGRGSKRTAPREGTRFS